MGSTLCCYADEDKSPFGALLSKKSEEVKKEKNGDAPELPGEQKGGSKTESNLETTEETSTELQKETKPDSQKETSAEVKDVVKAEVAKDLEEVALQDKEQPPKPVAEAKKEESEDLKKPASNQSMTSTGKSKSRKSFRGVVGSLRLPNTSNKKKKSKE